MAFARVRRLVADFRANEKFQHSPVFFLSASTGDLSCLGSNERNSQKAKARYGPSERARASHWKGVRCRNHRCNNLDRQIDALVYDLYGLTTEEIKIVEGANINHSTTN